MKKYHTVRLIDPDRHTITEYNNKGYAFKAVILMQGQHEVYEVLYMEKEIEIDDPICECGHRGMLHTKMGGCMGVPGSVCNCKKYIIAESQ